MQTTFSKVKTAVVGCGSISNIYIRNLKELFTIIDLVALCNRTREKAEAKAAQFGIPKVMTLEEIAADPEIELVVNLTAPGSHYQVTKQMLEAGKHVYSEKVFTTDLAQAQELTAIAKRKGLYLGVAPDTVLGAGIQTARRIIDLGLIGNVTSGFVSVTRSHNLMSELFPFLRGECGCLPYDVGVYYIGALIALLDSVKSIRGFASPALIREKQLLYVEDAPQSWQIPGNNLICAALEFTSGAVVSIHFNGNTVGDEQSRFELYGTLGMMKVGDPNTFDGKPQLILPESAPVEFPFTHGYDGRNRTSDPAPYDGSGHRGVGVAEMAYALRQGRENRLSGDYGIHCLEVLQGIDRAAATGETYHMQSSCTVRPLAPGFYSGVFGVARADAERSLID